MDARQGGSSLIEVLVSVLILALGMLGAAAVQTNTLRQASDALELTQASLQSQSLLEAMRAHRPGVLAGAYNTGGSICTVSTGGTSRASQDLRRWMNDVQAALGPSACAQVACSATVCKVRIRWRARWADMDDAEHEISIEARV